VAEADPVIVGETTDAGLTDQLLGTTFTPLTRGWLIAFALAGLGATVLFVLLAYTVDEGIGLWGNNIPVAWAFGIINFVWWIGIGHAGTFISAILLLLEQRWRTSINRFAEGMTLFAVVQAGLFPIFHTGRPWFAYWLIPYPATMRVWPNFKSALPWDVAAVTTYLTISVVFWYVGLIPDLASLRDRASSTRRRKLYGVFALGWRGSARHYRDYRVAYGLLAGLATPLVVSVHSVVSTDFAEAILPGWHSTIFPPLFVAGAIYSGFALVLTLMLPARAIFKVKNVITEAHLDAMAKMLLVTGWILVYSYIIEFFMAWYSGERTEFFEQFVARPLGPNNTVFWAMMVCNAGVVQLLWWRRVRTNVWLLWAIALLINVGMWSERFVIIAMSLQQDFLPSSWHAYKPTWVDIGIFTGTLGFFLFLFLLFLRVLPFIPTYEVKEMARHLREETP
jgi:molybdopterin-containing oxidoreductase family membrane subunit